MPDAFDDVMFAPTTAPQLPVTSGAADKGPETTGPGPAAPAAGGMTGSAYSDLLSEPGGAYGDLLGAPEGGRLNGPAAPEPGFLSSKAGRFLQGAAEPVVGTGQLLAHMLPFDGPAEYMDQLATSLDKTYQDSRKAAGFKEGDWDYSAGLGQIATSAIPAARVARAVGSAPGFLNSVVRGAGLGAAGAATKPVAQAEEKGYWGPKLEATAMGGVAGGALGPAFEVGAGVVLPQVADKAKELVTKYGVTPTFGQMKGGKWERLEDSLMSLPWVGDYIRNAKMRAYDSYTRGAANVVLQNAGQTLPANIESGRPLVNYVHAQAKQAMNDAYQGVGFVKDPIFTRRSTSLYKRVKADLGDENYKSFLQEVNSITNQRTRAAANARGAGAPLTAEQTQAAITDAKERIRTLTSGNVDQRRIARYLHEYQRLLEDGVSRQNKGFSKKYMDAARTYAAYTRFEAAAANPAALAFDGMFTPTQLGSAVVKMDPSLRHSSVARGNAIMQRYAELGKSVLPSKVPDSGTPERGFILGLLSGALPVNWGAALGSAAAIPAFYRPGTQDLMRRYLLANTRGQQIVAGGLRGASPYASMAGGAQAADGYADGGEVSDYLENSAEAFKRAPGDVARFVRNLPEGEGESPSLAWRGVQGSNAAIDALIQAATQGRGSLPGAMSAIGLPSEGMAEGISDFKRRNPALLKTLGALGEVAPGVAPAFPAQTAGAVSRAPGAAYRGLGRLGEAFEDTAAGLSDPAVMRSGLGGPPKSRSLGNAPLTPEQEALLETMRRPAAELPLSPRGKTLMPSSNFDANTAMRFVHPESDLAKWYEANSITGVELFHRTQEAVRGLKAIKENMAKNNSTMLSVEEFLGWAKSRWNPSTNDPRENRLYHSIQDALDAGYVKPVYRGQGEFIEITPLGEKALDRFKKSRLNTGGRVYGFMH